MEIRFRVQRLIHFYYQIKAQENTKGNAEMTLRLRTTKRNLSDELFSSSLQKIWMNREVVRNSPYITNEKSVPLILIPYWFRKVFSLLLSFSFFSASSLSLELFIFSWGRLCHGVWSRWAEDYNRNVFIPSITMITMMFLFNSLFL